jgi:nitroimidazol reductase NimA-like FMN-containing flavoprotein (pyridoxamine 5'-phosphate oxidase superfamily)
MPLESPRTELDSRFSTPDAAALPWKDAEHRLLNAGVFWISTVRPAGRPHVVPLIAVWLDGALYFATGEDEQKATNLATNSRVSITTGGNSFSPGLDIVVEGEATIVSDDAKLRRVADAFVAKYGESWRFPPREPEAAASSSMKSPPPRLSASAEANCWRAGLGPQALGTPRPAGASKTTERENGAR